MLLRMSLDIEVTANLHHHHHYQKLLSNPKVTQLNSKQLQATTLELDIVAKWPTPPYYPFTTKFSATSRPARELKIGTDTH